MYSRALTRNNLFVVFVSPPSNRRYGHADVIPNIKLQPRIPSSNQICRQLLFQYVPGDFDVSRLKLFGRSTALYLLHDNAFYILQYKVILSIVDFPQLIVWEWQARRV